MGSPTVVHGSRLKERERVRRGGGVIALGATVEFSRSRTARVPRQGYSYSRAHPRASERASQRVFASLMLTNEGVHNYRGNGGADPIYRSQSKHAETILRFRSSCFGAVRIRSESEINPIVSRHTAWRQRSSREPHPSLPFRRS